MADTGYAGRLVIWARTVMRVGVDIVKRSTEGRGFVVQRRRWIVERTLAWLFTHRRLVHDYERLPATHEAMTHIAMIMIMSRRLARTQTT